MKQPIAGVAPSNLNEVTVMTVWPTIASTSLGRLLGRLYSIDVGVNLLGVRLTLGKLIALASIPVALGLFFAMLVPPLVRRYRLTNKRIVVERGLRPVEDRSVSLERFDTIEVEVLPGQAWYPAGDLVFRLGPIETFRLSGVPRPETFRQTCLKANQSFVGVQKARQMGAAV